MNKEQLQKTYNNLFETDNGKTVLKDLESIIVRGMPFTGATSGMTGIDFATDTMLREGARHLLNYIFYQLGNDDNN